VNLSAHKESNNANAFSEAALSGKIPKREQARTSSIGPRRDVAAIAVQRTVEPFRLPVAK
jgi:hypothetical protein